MSNFADIALTREAEQQEGRADELDTLAEHAETAAVGLRERAATCRARAGELREALVTLNAFTRQWTKDELAAFAVEGHAALEPNVLSPIRSRHDWTPAAGQVDTRAYLPDGDTYGRDFVEPHLG